MRLSDKKLQELKDKKIQFKDLDDQYLIIVSKNSVIVETDNILKLLNESICSFKDIIDKFKSTLASDDEPCLSVLLWNKEFFEELIQNNLLNTEDTRYLLNQTDNIDELDKLCWNTSLIKYALNEFVLNKELVDKFNEIIENDDWHKENDIHTLFEFIEDKNKNNEEVLKLNELNRKVCLLNTFDLTKGQKLEIHEILRNNEIAKNTLIQIVDNNLEDTYDFEKLKSLLTRDGKKKKTKLNF